MDDTTYDLGLADIEAIPDGPDKAIQWIVCGLLEGECHHKQYFLERALGSLGVPLQEVRDQLQALDYEIAPGIPP